MKPSEELGISRKPVMHVSGGGLIEKRPPMEDWFAFTAIADQLYIANLLKIVELWPDQSEFRRRAMELVEGEMS